MKLHSTNSLKNGKVKKLNGDNVSSSEFLLNLLLNEFTKIDPYYKPDHPDEYHIRPSEYALEYLKLTGQFKNQFELCLKSFDGKKSDEFSDEFIDAVRKLYDDYVLELEVDMTSYASEKLKDDYRDFDFRNASVENNLFKTLLMIYFEDYGYNILETDYSALKCNRLRVHCASQTSLKNFERKLKK